MFWYEQHMGTKVLELLAEELDRPSVEVLHLLSGPSNLNDKSRRRYERFAEEMAVAGIISEWRILTPEIAREMHARVIFDASSTWELPPLNSLLKGTVDSIRPSRIPKLDFEEAWDQSGVPLAQANLERPTELD